MHIKNMAINLKVSSNLVYKNWGFNILSDITLTHDKEMKMHFIVVMTQSM